MILLSSSQMTTFLVSVRLSLGSESSTLIIYLGSIFRFLDAVVVFEDVSLTAGSSLWLSFCHSAGPSSLLKVVINVLIDSSVMRLKLTFAFCAADWKPDAWMWSLNWLKCSTVNVFKFWLIFNSSFSITLLSSSFVAFIFLLERALSSLYVMLSIDVKVSKLVSYLLVTESAYSLKTLSYYIS